MKFCFIHPFAYPPYKGGVEYGSYYLSREFAKLGHQVTVVTTRPFCSSLRSEDIAGVKYLRIQSVTVAFRINILLLVPMRTLIYEVLSSDIVYIKGLMTSFSIALGILCSILGKKTIVQVHAGDNGGQTGFARRFAFTLLGFFASFVLKRATLLQGETHSDIDLHRGHKGKNAEFVLVPPGISEQFFDPVNHAAEGRHLLQTTATTRVILFFGRINLLKGPKVAIEAFSMLRQDPEMINTLLVIAGADSPDLDTLKKKVKELNLSPGVSFLIDLDEDQKVWLYDAADVVIIPSLFDSVEAYCIALSEAWARSKPVIASRVGALSLRIHDGVDGLLVVPGSRVDLAAVIMDLLGNPSQMELLGRGVKQRPLSWGEVAGLMIAQAERIAKTKSWNTNLGRRAT